MSGDGDSKKYVPPHRRRRKMPDQDRVSSSPTTNALFPSQTRIRATRFKWDDFIQQAYCINLESRRDKWVAFQKHASRVGNGFLEKIQRFSAVPGAQANESELMDDIKREWDASINARYSKNVEPKLLNMSDGEVGCALSHIALWRKLVQEQEGDGRLGEYAPHQPANNNLLILEDDCDFVCTRGRDRFTVAFERAFKALPDGWEIFYLGFSHRGERTYIDIPAHQSNVPVADTHRKGRHRRDPMDPEIRLYRPEYGYHTHAYMITAAGARRLLDNLPVSGPIDVWLADNHWFDLNVYCAVIANEGWRLEDGTYEGKQLVHQVRGKDFQSDVQSGR